MTTRVGIVGFGSLGQFLAEKILEQGKEHGVELAFIWNRTGEKVTSNVTFAPFALTDLATWRDTGSTLILEVAHPSVTLTWGPQFLKSADYFCGSPTSLADLVTETAVMTALKEHGQRLYVPAGALWGAQDIARMARRGSLRSVHVTMAKTPSSLRLTGALLEKANAAEESGERVVLYDGPARALCPQAPNNVNTIACAALAGVGFDETRATLICDRSLTSHDIDIDVTGPETGGPGKSFRVTTQRINPSKPGAVTGSATYNSFFSSLLDAVGAQREKGRLHFV